MAPLTEDQLRDEQQFHLGILRRMRRTADAEDQPSQTQWDMAAETIVLATMNSMSDVALAARAGSRLSTPAPSVDTFTDDGTGNNRHIPRFMRQPITPPSVAEAIAEALPGVALDVPAVYRVAENEYGLWCCEAAHCGHFIDPARLRVDEIQFVRAFAAGEAAVSVDANGFGRISKGNANAARAALQLLVYNHYNVSHLSARGLNMFVSPIVRCSDGQHSVTWGWKTTWVAHVERAKQGSDGDRRRLAQALRHWIAEKGAAATERLRRPLLARYRLWARSDRLERKRTVQRLKAVGETDYDVAFQLRTHQRVADRTDEAIEVFDAHARAETLSEDIARFENFPRQPWPRDPPHGWETLKETQRQAIRELWLAADHMGLADLEEVVYGAAVADAVADDPFNVNF
ncbi:unnamed protein product [Peniophora sp. CBMAI 1063]|nr:unnamed protein product [Peniophora sp. CBMAI 1063]